jgi:hypothetical protein
MAWGTKGTRGSSLLVLHTFYKQRVSMALQQIHAISILRCDITLGEDSSRLGILSRGSPLLLFDILLMTKGHSKT